MNKIYHVSVNGNDLFSGNEGDPFRTISKAAEIASAGDTVIVHQGIYREWVSPENGGTSDLDRITYMAAPGEKAVIKGSERISDWVRLDGTVWKAEIPNDFFGEYNPYSRAIWGDWLIDPVDYCVHTGDVYLNGKSFYEAKSLEDIKKPIERKTGFTVPWMAREEYILHPEDTVYQWYAEVSEDKTVIYANFHQYDPNREFVEINVRPYCFYPKATGINYITVRGFEMAQAATPFTPPTADQPGLLGTHWSKGWVIENNDIHDSKCSGISIGKEASTGNNEHSRWQRNSGYTFQMEAVFKARHMGWGRETVGSHVIRNNRIHDCGQNGIVGHMGCVFSVIENNHIYNIATKHEFYGYEIAGIKLHAAIDVNIEHNHIHHCTLGIWLDWEAQGTRVQRNVLHHNDRDMMIEVTHGPCLVDNNILASSYNFDNAAQGTAFVHNLCCGIMRKIKVLDRSTPYHYPHSTEVAGVSFIYSGDDRIYNNIFVGGPEIREEDSAFGTAHYDQCTDSYEAYIEKIMLLGNADHEKYFQVEQPVYIDGNIYVNGARHCRHEKNYTFSEEETFFKVEQDRDTTYLKFGMPGGVMDLDTVIHGTETLGSTRISNCIFDSPDGERISIDKDYFGNPRNDRPKSGPFENIHEGNNEFVIWQD